MQVMAALHTGFGRLPAVDGLHAVTLDRRGRLRYEAPHPPSAGCRPLFFIHGFLSNPDLWQAMIAKLMASPGTAARYECYTYGYDYERSTQETGAMLAKQSGSLGLKNIVFICHSMGGLVAKEAASILIKIPGTVAKIITLGTPHNGVFLATLLAGATAVVKTRVIEATVISALSALLEDVKHEVARLVERFRVYLGRVADVVGSTPGTLCLVLPPPHQELTGLPCYVVVGNLFPLMGDGGGDGLVEVQSARGRGGWPAITRDDEEHFTEIRAFHVELVAPMHWLPGSRRRFESSCRAVTGYLNDHGKGGGRYER